LAASHTLFMREHNRIADELLQTRSADFATMTYGEKDEALYQRSRRAVIAQFQKIIFNGKINYFSESKYVNSKYNSTLSDFLPLVIGDKANDLKLTSRRRKYKGHEDASILNSFATAAFRYGHTMIRGMIELYTLGAMPDTFEQPIDLRVLFFNLTSYVRNNGEGFDMIVSGLINQVQLLL